LELPAAFSRRITGVFGDAGSAWLDGLPAHLSECADRWRLTIAPPFPLSYNYVAPALRADGTHIILKLGVPNAELASEIAALRHYGGRGAVRLLDADPGRGVLLLERIEPGTTLIELDDDEAATAIAAEVMRDLRRPPPSDHAFRTVADWAAGLSRLRDHFDGGTGPLPRRIVEIAEGMFGELLASMSAPVLLHGDLHHENILRAERRPWLAIDPKGVVGEPAYEVGAFLRNPMPQLLARPDLRPTLARRVDQLAEHLNFDRRRLLGWGIAQAVLSAWWSLEDHGGGWEPAITIAEQLAAIDEQRR
jgi:streptomycin 6-kinase